MFPLRSNVDDFWHVSCTSPEQEWIFLQADVGANGKTPTNAQATARKEFETADWPVTTRDGFDRAKQAV